MPIVYEEWITREMLRSNPNDLFVFGDNALRQGFGGQAKEMRGELNAVGVATKFRPDMEEDAFFHDDIEMAWRIVRKDLSQISGALLANRTVRVPAGGLGTGLSQLPTRAPRLYAFIYQFFSDMASGDCPWDKPK